MVQYFSVRWNTCGARLRICDRWAWQQAVHEAIRDAWRLCHLLCLHSGPLQCRWHNIQSEAARGQFGRCAYDYRCHSQLSVIDLFIWQPYKQFFFFYWKFICGLNLWNGKIFSRKKIQLPKNFFSHIIILIVYFLKWNNFQDDKKKTVNIKRTHTVLTK